MNTKEMPTEWFTTSFADVVYVLHAFRKKSARGIATPQRHIDLDKQRLQHRRASATREERHMSEEFRITESSGSVFADLDLPDAGTRMAKADLAHAISLIIQERGLTQQEAADTLGVDQPKVSAITRGRLADFSLDRLLTLVNRLGMDIEINVSPNPEPSRPSRLVVRGPEETLAAASPRADM